MESVKTAVKIMEQLREQKEFKDFKKMKREEVRFWFDILRRTWNILKHLNQEHKAREWLIKNAFKGYSIKQNSKV